MLDPLCNDRHNTYLCGGSLVAQWLSSLLDTEGPLVRASPASLCCVLEQDTLILA